MIVLAVLAVTIALFISDRWPLDLVAVAAVCALALFGVLSPREALSGFANPVVPMLAGLFIVGAGLQVTGVTRWLGAQLGRIAGGGEIRLLVVLMITSAVLSSFMSSTGTVAVLMPVAVTLAKRSGTPVARVLMPLAFASLFGGTLTLVGTPPNIVVNDVLRQNGAEAFGFFSYAGPGLVVLVLGTAYMLTIGRKLLPGGAERNAEVEGPASITSPELTAAYAIGKHIVTVEVARDSPLVGKTLREADLRRRYRVNITGILRNGDEDEAGEDEARLQSVVPALVIAAGDLLRLQNLEGTLDALLEEQRLTRRTFAGTMLPPEETLAELVVPRRSSAVGRTLRDIGFRTRHRSTVLAVQRQGETLTGEVSRIELRPGDALLVQGAVKNIDMIASRPRDFVVIGRTRSRDEVGLSRRAPVAIAATAGMLLLMSFQLVSNVIAVLLAVLALVLFRVLTNTQAYQRINWETVVVVAAVLPVSTALERTGIVKMTVSWLVSSLGDAAPVTILAVLFALTSVASQVMSNTATTVLIAPIAFQMATALGAAPQPFLMTVAVAASTAFATPIASPVNMLVLNAGGYGFKDFFKVGFPLQLAVFAASLVVIPWLFPL